MIRGSVLTAALLALLTTVPAGAAAATTAEPTLSIAISDEVTEVRRGDALDYVITLENAGPGVFDGTVALEPPAFLELESDGATADNGALSWEVSVPAGGSFEARAAGVVGDDIGEAYQVVVLASALDASGEVLVRAADADRISGTAEPPAVPGMEEPVEPVNWLPWAAVGGVLVLIAAGLVLAFRLRRRG